MEVPDERGGRARRAEPASAPRSPSRAGERGLFAQYKADQGIWTRRGTFTGGVLLIAWGAMFLKDQLAVYEDIEGWQGLLITPGIPFLFAVVVGALAWRIAFVSRKSSDFMIATEGEMKKVSWSSKREVIGSTKVVILFTVLLAVVLFAVDFVFQRIFMYIDVLKVS